jgi:ABC-type transport system substrate-binding protein
VPALLRAVVHTRPGGRAGRQPELPRKPSAPLHRTLFGDVRVRQAVNYAIGRRTPTRLGDFLQPPPERPTDHNLPPGMPGFRDVDVYPTRPDVAKARTLVRQAHAGGRTAVLDTGDAFPCPQQAQITRLPNPPVDAWARCCETDPWSQASTIRSTGVSSPAARRSASGPPRE